MASYSGYGPFNPLGSSASSTGVRANFDGGYGDSYGGGISAENQVVITVKNISI